MVLILVMRCDCAKTCPKHKVYQRKTELAEENEVKKKKKKSLKGSILACSILIKPTQPVLHLPLFHLLLLVNPEKPET